MKNDKNKVTAFKNFYNNLCKKSRFNSRHFPYKLEDHKFLGLKKYLHIFLNIKAQIDKN